MTDELLIEVPESDHGIEALRAEKVPEGGYRLLSVPVFLYGISRGAVVEAGATTVARRLRYRALLAPSLGATVRCYVTPDTTPRRLYEDHLRDGAGAELGLGPVSLFDPDIVAVHVADRARLNEVAAYLDRLVLAGVVNSWESADPGAPTSEQTAGPGEQPWELVHPPTQDAHG